MRNTIALSREGRYKSSDMFSLARVIFPLAAPIGSKLRVRSWGLMLVWGLIVYSFCFSPRTELAGPAPRSFNVWLAILLLLSKWFRYFLRLMLAVRLCSITWAEGAVICLTLFICRTGTLSGINMLWPLEEFNPLSRALAMEALSTEVSVRMSPLVIFLRLGKDKACMPLVNVSGCCWVVESRDDIPPRSYCVRRYWSIVGPWT